MSQLCGRTSTVFISSFILLTHLLPIRGQVLTTQTLDVKLPAPDACQATFYDGDDSIYLFGGSEYPQNKQILKFTIFSETLQVVGTLPEASICGHAYSDSSRNIFYLGGGDSGATWFKEVYKFNPVTGVVSHVANLPYTAGERPSFKFSETSNTILVFGDDGEVTQKLSAFDLYSLTSSTVSTNFTFYANSATAIKVGSKAFLFGVRDPEAARMAVEVDVDTFFNMQYVGLATLPTFTWHPSSVWDGNYGYVIGGYDSSTGVRTDGIIQFNPVTYENRFIPVENFPVGGSSHFWYSPATVFVPSRNRIYFFGGYSSIKIHDEIFYIDLTPLDVTPSNGRNDLTLTSCNRRRNGKPFLSTNYLLVLLK